MQKIKMVRLYLKATALNVLKKQGINPLKNLSQTDMNNMTKQIENIVSNLAENMDLDSFSEQLDDMDPEDLEKNGARFSNIWCCHSIRFNFFQICLEKIKKDLLIVQLRKRKLK